MKHLTPKPVLPYHPMQLPRGFANDRTLALFLRLGTLYFVAGALTVSPIIDAEAINTGQRKFKKLSNTSGEPLRTRININKISAWYDADGTEERNSATGNSGLTYPKGTTTAVFTSGLMWSGFHHDGIGPVVRANGHMYNTGFAPGAILGVRTGVSENQDAPDVRIWRVRRDYATEDLAADASDVNEVALEEVTSDQIESVKSQYERDWLEWPAHKGAPFYDAEDDGMYEPSIVDGTPVFYPDADEPGLGNADQVIWYVANDLPGSPWGGTRTGIEVQQTIWAYERPDALGETVFKRYRVIYKGLAETPVDATIDSMYIGQFSDPDLGAYADDFVGCDSLAGLGYCYNSNPIDVTYAQFGLPPPAIGHMMLAGPLVSGVGGQDLNRNGVDDASDRGIFDLRQTVMGTINLPLTSFIYCASGGLDCYNLNPPNSLSGAYQIYCSMQGGPGTPQPPPCPPPHTDPATGRPAPKFWLYGDPITRAGWIDGMLEGPGDRRVLLSSGPYSMAVGDTQEIVVAVIGGLGENQLNSIARLRLNARLVQVAYQNLFTLPEGPPQPLARAVGFDRQILLDWEFDPSGISATEDSIVAGGYAFEGYKIYQCPDATGDLKNAKLLAQFDIVNGVTNIQQLIPDPITGELLPRNVQYGTDNGIRRTLAVSVDSLRAGSPLVNGRAYYFGVSAYSYTPDSLLQIRMYESEPVVLVVQPETPKPGTRYAYSIGDTVSTVTQLVGRSDVRINPVVYNPEKQTGDSYQLLFDTTAAGTLAWSLTNRRTGVVLHDAVEGFSSETLYRIQESGFDISVGAPPTGVVSVIDQEVGDAFGTIILSVDGTLEGLGGTAAETGEDYELRFGEESFVLSAQSPSFYSKPIRVPFAAYQLGRGADDPSAERVMAVVFDSASTPDTWNRTPVGRLIGDSLYAVFEPIHVSDYPYISDDPATSLREDSQAIASQRSALYSMTFLGSTSRRSLYGVFVIDVDADGLPPDSGSVQFNKYHEVRAGDEFEISLESLTSGDAVLAKNDVAAIKAFPNPYYGLNIEETSVSDRFITFNHLPAKAVIRIYSLAGIHVRKLVKDDATTQYFRWDLKNEHNRLAASGIYVVYMELQDVQGIDLGKKTLKLAIIQEAR